MNRALILVAVALALVCPAWASSPGQPLDCSDWVLEPGLNCTSRDVQHPDDQNAEMWFWNDFETNETCVDNEDDLIRFVWAEVTDSQGAPVFCGPFQLHRIVLMKLSGSTLSVMGSVADRCVSTDPPLVDGIYFANTSQIGCHFLPHSGELILDWVRTCYATGPGCSYGVMYAPPLAVIGGLKTDVACPDADGDAWADCTTVPKCNPYGKACGDCNDNDAEVNPGASEQHPKRHRNDGKDNDCNGVIDG